jgi:hypothetical protein
MSPPRRCSAKPSGRSRELVESSLNHLKSKARFLVWSLSNAFTLAFKELEPIPLFKATAKVAEFLEARFLQSF